MSQEIDREGTFRGVINSYWIRDAKEGKATAVAFIGDLQEYYNEETEQWEDWRQYQYEGEGALWIIKKDGSLNNNAIESLVANCDWDGDLTSISQKTFNPTPCQFVVKSETYRDQVRYRIEFVNDFSASPNGGKYVVSDEKVNALKNQYGSQMRALAGQFKRNSTKPAATSKPAAPPPKKQSPQPVNAGSEPVDEVPF